MKNPALFYGAIVVAVIAIVLGIYYAIPGVYHPLTSSAPTDWHPAHVALFAIIAIICIIAALVNRPRTIAR